MRHGTASARRRGCPSASVTSWRGSATRRVCWTASMVELAAALCAGAAFTVAIISVASPVPLADSAGVSAFRSRVDRLWLREAALASSTALPWLDGVALIGAEVVAAICGAAAALLFTGLPALSLAAGAGGVFAVRLLVATRIHS